MKASIEASENMFSSTVALREDENGETAMGCTVAGGDNEGERVGSVRCWRIDDDSEARLLRYAEFAAGGDDTCEG